jgi:NTE family protein
MRSASEPIAPPLGRSPRPNATTRSEREQAIRRRAVCAVGAAAAFVVFLDVTIVNVAFHAIERSFASVSRADVALTLTAYAVALGALLLPAGRFGDHLGHRRVFLVAFTAFAAASALCGLAVSAGMLIAARVLQGAAAACMAPSSLALMLPWFGPERRAYVVGIWSGAAGAAALLGPALGGVAVHLLGWRSIFLVNVPIGALAVGTAARVLPPEQPSAPRPDLAATALSAAAAVALTVALLRAAATGWGKPTVWTLLAAGGACVALCAARGRVSGRPLADPRLLADRTLRRASLATLLTSAAGFALMFANMLFLTTVWRYSALQLGLAVSPGPVMTALATVPAGRLADRFGVPVVAVPGALLLAGGAGWFALRTTSDPRWLATWLPGSLMTGIGIGLSFPAIGAGAGAPGDAPTVGTAVAVNGLVRQIGAVAGITLVVSLLRGASAAAAPALLHRTWGIVAALAVAGAAAAAGLRGS